MTSFSIQPPVFAHRGASAYAPENTFAAFIKAVQLGIKWIEFDVMQSACSEPIIFHDKSLKRTANLKGNVIDFPFSYLQTVDVGQWFNPFFAGEKIPSLSQVLEFLKNANVNANIEIKPIPGKEEVLVKQVLEKVTPYLRENNFQVIFSSFSIETLKFLRMHSPDCNIGLLMHEWIPDWREISTALDCVSIHVSHKVLTEAGVQKIKESGKSLFVYTVNDPVQAQELFSFGVDAVFSDVPDKILLVWEEFTKNKNVLNDNLAVKNASRMY